MAPPSRSGRTTPSEPAASRRSRPLYLLPLILGGVLLFFLLYRSGSTPSAARDDAPGSSSSAASAAAHSAGGATAGAAAGSGGGAVPPTEGNPGAAQGEEAPPTDPELARLRLERAEFTLKTYLEANRYPPQSRPIQEHPDQIRPSRFDTKVGLRRGGEGRLRMGQDRIFLSGDEGTRLYVSGEDSTGNSLPLKLISAIAAEAPFSPGAGVLSPVALNFTDSGNFGDETAGDSTYTTLFQPGKQGFDRHLGNIRVTITAQVGDDQGSAFFDVYYTPQPPARFTGTVREALENGSLSLYLGLDVKKPGRYVIAGRADDAAGKPFAYLSFNDVVSAGTQEVKMVIFGKLVRDLHAPSPFHVRDVEGFLLKEDADPDREIVPAQLGPLYATRTYAENLFSDAEWDSEEKRRHVEQFEKDVEQHKGATGGK